jgi:hypothetical protein
MTSEIEAFRAELRAAGQPWQQRGVKVVLAGFVILAMAQILSAYAMLLLALAIAVIAVGWGMLVVAFIRRRQWAKTHDLTMPTLTDAP